jgi:hypothetical protein
MSALSCGHNDDSEELHELAPITEKRGRSRKVLKKGIKTRVKNKGSQRGAGKKTAEIPSSAGTAS